MKKVGEVHTVDSPHRPREENMDASVQSARKFIIVCMYDWDYIWYNR